VLQVALTRLLWARALRARGEAAPAGAHFERALSQLTASGCDYAVANAHRLSA
jgi:hypothetical protein